MIKKNIAVLFGGDSSEYAVSERSAGEVFSAVDTDVFNPFLIRVRKNQWFCLKDEKEIPVNLNDFSIDQGKTRFDFAFIIIHGTPGEDGKLQAYLDMMRVPYNTPGVLVSALSFNKMACKLYLKNFDVLTPEAVVYRRGNAMDPESLLLKTGLPCFVKPNNGGSSFGTSKVTRTEDLEKAINDALREDEEVIIESFVKGTELTCGVLKTSREEIILPVTEIVSKNDFFDYEAKYTVGMADEIVPARVEKELQEKVQKLSGEIYDHLQCKGLVRIDFIARGNQVYFLEINTVPGMSPESIVPKELRAVGIKLNEVVTMIIEDGLNKY